MQFYRCKCGNYKIWSSNYPPRCISCRDCGTTIDSSPNDHEKPMEHELVKQFDQNTGEPYEICLRCLEKFMKEVKKDI